MHTRPRDPDLTLSNQSKCENSDFCLSVTVAHPGAFHPVKRDDLHVREGETRRERERARKVETTR